MNKAKFQGHCQVCGHRQKLPNGKLSKHGYTTRCGFFEGVCFGAGHLPFEQDKTLVDESIERAEVRRKALKKYVKEVLASTNPNDVIYHAYGDWGKYTGNYRIRSGYVDIRGRVEARPFQAGDRSYNQIYFVGEYYGKPYEDSLRFGIYDLAAAVKHLNESEANRTDQIIRQIDDYIQWQRHRIKDWKVVPLIPVEETV